MTVRAYSLVKRHPFLFFGILTFGLFLVGGSLSDAARTSEPARMVVAALRVLIIPLWLMRDLEMLIGLRGPVGLVVGLPLLFAPYILADYLLYRARVYSRSSHGSALKSGGGRAEAEI